MEAAIEDLVIPSCVVLSIVLVSSAGVIFYKRLRRRGIRAHIATLGLSACTLLPALFAIFLDLWLTHGPLARYTHARGHTYAVDEAIDIFATLCFIACFLLALGPLERRLRPRQKSAIRGGPRKGFFYFAVTFLTVAAAFAAVGLFSLWESHRTPGYYDGGAFIWFLLGFVYFAVGLFALLKSRRARPLQQVLASDPRPPVLFVRVFKEENLPFGDAQLPWWLSPIARQRVPVTMERYLIAAVERQLGPFVALGNPDDVAEAIGGAARQYFATEEWRTEFQRLAATCRAILILPGNSRELLWEMQWLLASGNTHKLFLLFGQWAYGRDNPGDKLLERFLAPRRTPRLVALPPNARHLRLFTSSAAPG